MRTQGQQQKADESEPGSSHLPGNGSGSAPGDESQLLDSERSSAKSLADNRASSTSLARRASGPQTLQGKERSKYNALKHGIFSEVVVLKGESRAEHQSLLKGLQQALRPEGKLEETLAEKLATILWRHRRMIVAEGAEIQKSIEFLEWDQQNRQHEEAEEIGSSDLLDSEPGFIWKIQNPDVLDRCLELLAELREGIEADGFDSDRDNPILEKIYSERDKGHLRETLYDTYFIWLNTAEASEEERQREGFATPEQCKQNILDAIDAEVRWLKRYRRMRAAIEANRTKLEMLRQGVPDSPGLDRLLRYEASLERAFDRTLSQLERFQRMRLGQPVPPPLKVDVSE